VNSFVSLDLAGAAPRVLASLPYGEARRFPHSVNLSAGFRRVQFQVDPRYADFARDRAMSAARCRWRELDGRRDRTSA
jgi:hypothetical protein